MTVDKALEHANEWTRGHTFYEGQEGWRVVCAVLATEVRRLQRENEQLKHAEQAERKRCAETSSLEQAMADNDCYEDDFHICG